MNQVKKPRHVKLRRHAEIYFYKNQAKQVAYR